MYVDNIIGRVPLVQVHEHGEEVVPFQLPTKYPQDGREVGDEA